MHKTGMHEALSPIQAPAGRDEPEHGHAVTVTSPGYDRCSVSLMDYSLASAGGMA
jgi:hypothetical protein